MNEIQLKPCPFCGGKAELSNGISRSVPAKSVASVFCSKCHASTYRYNDNDGSFAYMLKAVSAWNRRADNG